MNWNGKIIGALLGLFLGGPIGLLIGLGAGFLYDQGSFRRFGFDPSNFIKPKKAHTKHVFFTTTFAIMGYIAKSDGRVSEREIQAAQSMMTQLQLSAEQKRSAIEAFNFGKLPNFDVGDALNKLKRACLIHPSLLRTFLEMQIQIAYAEGPLTKNKRYVLENVCQQLGIRGFNFSQFENQYRTQQNYQYQAPRQRPQHSLNEAYTILGISRQANKDEVKKAYRRLMNRNHPDKLIAKGVPEEMIQLATQKTQQIKKAYDTIRKARGF